MIQYLKNRLASFVEECVAKQTARIAAAVTPPPLDFLAIASQVQRQMDLDPIIEQTVDRLKTGHTVEYDRLAECIDGYELARQFDLYDIAGHLDYSELASNLDSSAIAGEIDTSDMAADVAEHVEVDAEEVAEHLDYKRLALALLDAVRAGA